MHTPSYIFEQMTFGPVRATCLEVRYSRMERASSAQVRAHAILSVRLYICKEQCEHLRFDDLSPL